MAAALPTPQTYAELQTAYSHFNRELFSGQLPPCLLTLQRKPYTEGYFSPHCFINEQQVLIHEIALNPHYFAIRSLEEVLSTLVHEMAHLYHFESGEQLSRSGYHNRRFAAIMKAIGLHPSTTGRPGGKETGQSLSHYIVEQGPFILACRKLMTETFCLTWYDRYIPPPKECPPPPPTSYEIIENTLQTGVTEATLSAAPAVQATLELFPVPRSPATRQKYRCSCGHQVWGKPRLRLSCLDCQTPYQAVYD